MDPLAYQREFARRLGKECSCSACLDGLTYNGLPAECAVMILCPECANKRCPKATDHRHACTGSNRPGQVGSVYQ
jgi:hypothetical protein